MKIDSHQHFWRYSNSEYSWIGDGMEVIKRDYMPSDLLPDLAASGYSGTVAVQARQSFLESEWLLDLAGENDFIKGVVGWVDLCNESKLRNQLAVLCSNRKFAGVRHVVHDEPDKRFMLRDNFLRGISVLGEFGLTYDLLLFPEHLEVARELVAMFPGQKFVIDHLAKPGIRMGITEPWRREISLIAQYSNVWCKLSGMVTEADHTRWKKEDFRPYLDTVFNAFGPGRLMAGSDWPVSLLCGSYSAVMGITEEYLAGFTEEDREKVLGENCRLFYGLG